MRKLFGAALACALALVPALVPAIAPAQQAPTSTVDQGKANAAAPWWTQLSYGGAALSGTNGLPVSIVSGGSGGSAGSVTAAGTNGSTAQAVQGITGGIPVNGFLGQYNATLQTLSSGASGYLSLDGNGRLLLAPTGSINADLRISGAAVTGTNQVPISVPGAQNPPGSSGTVALTIQGATSGLPLLIQGGNSVAVKTDGSATTQPISAAALPLPAGAATAVKQPALGTAGTPAADVLTVQGSSGGTPLPVATNSSVAVTDASGTLAAAGTASPLAANTARQILVITNTGANPMTVRFGSAATATAGHILAPGANITFDDKCPTGSVNLFSTGGTTFFVTSG